MRMVTVVFSSGRRISKMYANTGDYIKFNQIWGDPTSERITSKVVAIHFDNHGKNEIYETESGDFVCENELGLDDVFLQSEKEGA